MMFLVVAILLFTGWQLFNYAEKTPGHTPPSKTGTAPNRDGSQERRPPKPAPWPTDHYKRPNFEAGIAFPQWSALDSASIHLKKPIIITEIGYRNTADTLYNSWSPYSTASPADPTEQAAACNAALVNVIPDPYIAGIFFWSWDGVGGFKLSGQPAPATNVLYNWYSSPQS